MPHLLGAGAVPFGSDRDPATMVRGAARAAMEDAGIERADVDLLVVANAAAEGLAGVGNVATWTATQCGLVDAPAWRVETGPSSGLAAFAVACDAVAAGRARHALALGWESMTRVPTAEATRLLARLMADDERRAGLSLPALVAMMTTAYTARYGVDDGDLARVAVKAHALAANNPIAQFRRAVSVEDVLASRTIAEPVRLLHCAPMTDGAAAVVVAREGPVRVRALGHATDHLGLTQRRGPVTHFTASRTAAQRAYAAAGLGPDAIDVVELHDAFSVLEAVNLEDLSLAREGAGLAVALAGAEPSRARPAVNPSGGLKARGHPVGATGVAQACELFDQLTGRAANQAPDARVGLAHNIGGFGNNVHVAILEGGA